MNKKKKINSIIDTAKKKIIGYIPHPSIASNTGYPVLFRNKVKFRDSSTTPASNNNDVLLYLGIIKKPSKQLISVNISRLCYTPSYLHPGHLRMLSYKNPDKKTIYERIRDKLYNWSKNVLYSDESVKMKNWFNDLEWSSDTPATT